MMTMSFAKLEEPKCACHYNGFHDFPVFTVNPDAFPVFIHA